MTRSGTQFGVETNPLDASGDSVFLNVSNNLISQHQSKAVSTQGGSLHFQVANTWPKITGRDVYAMVRNGKKPENPQNLSVAATFEKANT